MKRYVSSLLVAAMLGLVTASTMGGCGAAAAIISTLPAVIKLVTDAALVLDTIHDYVDTYEELSPESKAEIHSAIETARLAFDALKETSKTAKSMDDKDFVAAMESARKAYDAVFALCSKHGVRVQTTETRLFGAIEHDALIVPSFDRLKADSL
jgi:hypothetical protein